MTDMSTVHDNRFYRTKESAAVERVRDAAPELLKALKAAVKIAQEARIEWDEAPNGMRAGKILIALAGDCPGYRSDIDAIHAAIAKATGAAKEGCAR